MKKLFTIIFAVVCGEAYSGMTLKAEDCFVKVDKAEESLTIYAKCIGVGETLEAAKLDAYNQLLPQLISKTQGAIPTVQNSYSANGEVRAEGIENLVVDKMLLQGYWELKDGKYIYKSELLIDNTKQE